MSLVRVWKDGDGVAWCGWMFSMREGTGQLKIRKLVCVKFSHSNRKADFSASVPGFFWGKCPLPVLQVPLLGYSHVSPVKRPRLVFTPVLCFTETPSPYPWYAGLWTALGTWRLQAWCLICLSPSCLGALPFFPCPPVWFIDSFSFMGC